MTVGGERDYGELMRRATSAALSLVLAVAALAPAATVAVSERLRWKVCGEWRQVPVPEPRVSGELRDIAVVSPTEAWAVGVLGAEGILQPLVLHWNGIRWERVRFPALRGDPDFAILESVAVTAAGEVWAVGAWSSMNRTGHPLTARWDGGRWHVVPLPDPGLRGYLDGLAAVHGTDTLWAVGQMIKPHEGALAMRWTGERWRRFRVPDVVPGATQILFDVVAFARTTWAVGRNYGPGDRWRMVAARWHDGRWRTSLGPAVSPFAVAGTQPNRLWAVGGVDSDRPGYQRPAIVRWNGERWSRAYTGGRLGFLRDVVTPAPGVAWAVGERVDGPLMLRLGEQGWAPVRIPDVRGWFGAIDGTPNNLWVTHARLWRGSEPTVYDTYHRC